MAEVEYIYIPNAYEGHTPANKELVEEYENGKIYSVPVATTMHMDMAMQLRSMLMIAQADARFHGAGEQISGGVQDDVTRIEFGEQV